MDEAENQLKPDDLTAATQTSDDDLQFEDDDTAQPSASLLLHNYLQSANGHEIAKQVLDLIKGLKHSTLDRNVEQDKVNAEQTRLQTTLVYAHHKRLLISQTIVFVFTIVATGILTYFGKFDAPVAILFGTLVGYFFGRKSSSKSE